MFDFEKMVWVWSLLAIAGIVGVYYYTLWLSAKRQKYFRKNVSPPDLKSFFSFSNKYLLYLVSFGLFATIALMNPQWGNRSDMVKVEKSDIVIALDISESMNASDIGPTRLEKAKKLIESIIIARKSDRIGLILFAGAAYLQMPLTTDYAAALMFARTANSNLAGTQGTAIGDAVNLAVKSTKDDKNTQKALIIITDGEDHDSEAIKAAKDAYENGWVIHAIGIGTLEGGNIPTVVEGREIIKLDDNGNAIISKLNPALIKDLAMAGGGKAYIYPSSTDVESELNNQLNKIQKRIIELKSIESRDSFFQLFLLGALVCMYLILVAEGSIKPLKKY